MILKKFIELVKRDGVYAATKKAFLYVGDIIKSNCMRFLYVHFSVEGKIHRRRIYLSNMLFKKLNGVVGYGPFKGFRLGDKFKWGRADAGSMLLGFYEKEIMESLVAASKTHKTFIDLGGADGYFSVGCLAGKLFDYTYCYEISEKSRENIEYCARLNDVSERLSIFGQATTDFYRQIQAADVDLSNCVLLCDIEGGEFNVFNEHTFRAFQGATILIEIHEWHKNGIENYAKLKYEASKFFRVTELTMGSRDLSKYPEVSHFHDSDRWLLCSEGRGQLMKWLKLESLN